MVHVNVPSYSLEMTNLKEKIITDLINIGVKKRDSLLVHSSLNSLGKFENRAEIITEAILSVLGEDGTLLMPSLSYEIVGNKNPIFNIQNTPSCVGSLTEYFRVREDTIRSVHPTHSVAGLGENAISILGDHHLDFTPAGVNSPFSKLKEINGKILFLGCGLKPNTSMHGVEELVEPIYLYGDDITYTITTSDEKQAYQKYRNHNFHGFVQRYDRLENLMETKYLRKGKVLEAECYLIDSVAMWEVAHKKMLEDPLYFIDQVIE